MTARHFRFLETEFGFIPEPSKPPFIAYGTQKSRVLIYYDADGRHELDMRIRYLGDDPGKIPAIGIGEVILLTDSEAAKGFLSPFPATESSLEYEVSRLAKLLRKNGTAFLNGDQSAFEKIQQLRRKREAESEAER